MSRSCMTFANSHLEGRFCGHELFIHVSLSGISRGGVITDLLSSAREEEALLSRFVPFSRVKKARLSDTTFPRD